MMRRGDLSGGEIVQSGTHEELAHVDGKYSEMWSAQAWHYIRN